MLVLPITVVILLNNFWDSVCCCLISVPVAPSNRYRRHIRRWQQFPSLLCTSQVEQDGRQ